MSRPLQWIVRLAAASALLAVVAGVPWALTLLGSPVDGLQALRAGDASDTAIIAVLTCVTWVAWAQVALAIVVDLAAVLVRVPMPTRVPGVLAGQQRLARALVSALILAAPLTTPLAANAAPPPAQSAPISAAYISTAATPTHVETSPTSHTARSAEADRAAPGRQGTGHRTVTITSTGPQTLWDLAEEHLGDGQRWHDIWNLNQGRTQADGTTMHNPDLLKIGWTIAIPTTPTAPAPAETHDIEVKPGDSLSSIARDTDTTWQALWESNHGTRQTDGRTFHDPDLIRPGWKLDIPTTGSPGPQISPHEPGTTSGHSSPSADAPSSTDSASEPKPHESPRPTGDARQPTAAPPTTSTTPPTQPTTTATPTTSAPETAAPQPSTNHDQDAPGDPAWIWLTPGAGLLAGLTVLALRRQRRRQRRHRRPGRMIGTIPPELSSTEKALVAGGESHVPDVQWIDAALRDLSAQLAADHRPLPDLLAAIVTHSTLELILAPTRTDPDRLDDSATSVAVPPLPWHSDPGSPCWRLHRSNSSSPPEQPEAAQASLEAVAPPYPALVGIGHDEDRYILLDLEHAPLTHLIGNAPAAEDLARFVAAELAHNTWSEQLRLAVYGLGDEVVGINPARLQHSPNPDTAISDLHRDLSERLSVLDDLGYPDVLAGRQHDQAGDAWMPQLAMIAPIDRDHVAGQAFWPPAIHAVAHDLQQRRRTGVALILIGDDPPAHAAALHEHITDWWLHIDAHGRLSIPALGITTQAHQLTATEAARISELLATAENLTDQPVPASRGPQPWESFSDATGNPAPGLHTVDSHGRRIPLQIIPSSAADNPSALPELLTEISLPAPDPAPGPPPPESSQAPDNAPPQLPAIPGKHPDGTPEATTTSTGNETDPTSEAPQPNVPPHDMAPADGPRSIPPGDPDVVADAEPEVRSVLLPATSDLLSITATTPGDVQRLSPAIGPQARQRIESSDPDLDADLQAWRGTTQRPRLSILGPVQVRASGQPLAKRVAWHAEVLCYLAAHPRGVSGEQMETDLWPHDLTSSTSRLRNALYLLRGWLGRDQDGQLFLPHATAAAPGGPGLYQVHRLLTDADLFRRLRLRGVARGPQGLHDLEQALALVTGPPFMHRRPGGYSWLTDLPLDHEYTAMVIDTAHLVATAHLTEQCPTDAITAAQTALKVDANSDIALLDLVAACDQLGLRAEADSWVARLLHAHDAEIEEDLPPRTAEILHRRHLGQST